MMIPSSNLISPSSSTTTSSSLLLLFTSPSQWRCSSIPLKTFNPTSQIIHHRPTTITSTIACCYQQQQHRNEQEGNNRNDGEEEEFRVLSAIKSNYNDILILDTPHSRFLLLDSTHNVHSMYDKRQKWTDSYWDELASLPAILPKGPIAILGLGGGTAAHLMLDLWPSLELEGWDIDGILIDKAREYLGLSNLEKRTPAGGILHVRIGDALSDSVTVPGGYAGIVIDLFANGKILPQLKEVATWLKLNDKLMPNGRLMVNCAGADNEVSDTMYPEISPTDDWKKNSTITAMSQAFPGEVNWKKMSKEGENYLALTGSLPDLDTWSVALSNRLSLAVKQWRPCFPTDS